MGELSSDEVSHGHEVRVSVVLCGTAPGEADAFAEPFGRSPGPAPEGGEVLAARRARALAAKSRNQPEAPRVHYLAAPSPRVLSASKSSCCYVPSTVPSPTLRGRPRGRASGRSPTVCAISA